MIDDELKRSRAFIQRMREISGDDFHSSTARLRREIKEELEAFDRQHDYGHDEPKAVLKKPNKMLQRPCDRCGQPMQVTDDYENYFTRYRDWACGACGFLYGEETFAGMDELWEPCEHQPIQQEDA